MPKNTNDLDALLQAEEPQEDAQPTAGSTPFRPKFNVREEFATWVRKEFPDLPQYSGNRRRYKALEARKQEVLEAAMGAIQHGELSTTACATARLNEGRRKFERTFAKRPAHGLAHLVEAIESLSISLGGDPHYTEAGVILAKRGLDAYIYRIGEERGHLARYEVHYVPYPPPEEPGEVHYLIGEFTDLLPWQRDRLRDVVGRYRGSEGGLIDRVDRMFPQSGTGQISYVPQPFDRHQFPHPPQHANVPPPAPAPTPPPPAPAPHPTPQTNADQTSIPPRRKTVLEWLFGI